MRLFLAAEIGEALAGRVAELIRALQERAAEAATARVTWIPAGRLHVTVRFIGEVAAEGVVAIRTALGSPIAAEAGDLVLRGVGVFPERGAPRVIWAGVAEGRDALIAAERDVSARLARLGIAGDVRRYSPHLTLARVRDAGGMRSARLIGGLEHQPIGTTRIDAITLFQSTLSLKGPTYVPLLRVPMARPA